MYIVKGQENRCQECSWMGGCKTDFKTAYRSRKLEEFFSILGNSHISRMVKRRFRFCPKFLDLQASIQGNTTIYVVYFDHLLGACAPDCGQILFSTFSALFSSFQMKNPCMQNFWQIFLCYSLCECWNFLNCIYIFFPYASFCNVNT